MQEAAVWSAGRQHKAQISFPGTVSAWGLGSRWRSGVVLLTSPVDVLEEGHGEGHAQNLKDTGNGLRQKPHGWGHRQQKLPLLVGVRNLEGRGEW